MSKIQSIVIILAIIILTMMGVASTMKVVPIVAQQDIEIEDDTPNIIEVNSIKQEPLDKLSIFITKMILEYLEIETCFEYILQTRTCFHTHRTTATHVAYGQYAAFLTCPSSRFSTAPQVLTRLQHYVKFLHTPLDSTVLFPEPTIQVLGRLRLVNIPRSEPPAIVHTIIKRFLQHYNDQFQYEYTDDSQNVGHYWGAHLPLVYDPQQSLLQLYRMADTHLGIQQYVHLPAILLFRGDEEEILVEHVWEWIGFCWTWIKLGRSRSSTISWITKSFGWMVQMGIAENGDIQKISVLNVIRGQYGTFRLSEDKRTYVLDTQNISTFAFTSIVAFYYPSAREPTYPERTPKDLSSTTKDEKKYNHRCCCNII